MKILYFSSHPHVSTLTNSGAGTHIREMINAFKELGHEVEVLVVGDLTRGKKSANVQTNKKYPTSLLKKCLPKTIKSTLKDFFFTKKDEENYHLLEKKIKSFQPDLIYERGIYLLKSGTDLAKKYGIQHILEINAPLSEEKKKMQGPSLLFKRVEQVEKINFKQTNLAVFVSEALKNYYTLKYPFLSGQTIVTPNAINLNSIPIASSEEVNKKYGLGNVKVIGFVGSIFPYHGVDLLIRAFAELVHSGKHSIKLMIVGDGYMKYELEALSQDLGIRDQVIFTGYISHEKVFSYIQAFDIAVMVKSNWYGSPVKLFEYGAMKKAIIAPDQPPVREVMTHGQDGWITKPSIPEIKTAIEKILNQPALNKEYGDNFHKKVVKNYTWKHNAIEVIKKLKK